MAENIPSDMTSGELKTLVAIASKVDPETVLHAAIIIMTRDEENATNTLAILGCDHKIELAEMVMENVFQDSISTVANIVAQRAFDKPKNRKRNRNKKDRKG